MTDRTMLPPDEPGADDLESLFARYTTRPLAEREAAVAAWCRAHPDENASAILRAMAEFGAQPEAERMRTGSLEERLARLKSHAPAATRYRLMGEVARGGMGAILRVHDDDLGRTLAMKVILGQGQSEAPGQTPPVDPKVLSRFLDEAQITGQLDHPGVVPVHELGMGSDGRVYFTMRLVKGKSAAEVFEQARAGHQGWTPTKALEVVLKICDTLAYAHAKGVVHRDLKPSNVMVGKFGEVYVMDWGLAKVVGQEDRHDLRLRQPPTTVPSAIATDRSKEAASDPDSPLITMDGAVVGTPSYMSPEQAEGRLDEVDERSDVYAAGACLYTLLTGWQPYLRPGTAASPYTILNAVRDGAPRPVHDIDAAAPPELVAVCEKAMARDRGRRYASMGALADDLRAFLGHRVVKAYQSGAWAELTKWVSRNRGVAAGVIAAFVATVGGAIVSLRFYVVAEANATLAERRGGEARTSAHEARALAYRIGVGAAWRAFGDGRSAAAVRQSLIALPEEMRHWEWDYLDVHTQQGCLLAESKVVCDQRFLFSAAVDGLDCPGFGSDGRVLVARQRDGIRIMDVGTGEVLKTLAMDPVPALASIRPNGRLLAVADQTTLRVLATDTWTERFARSLDVQGAPLPMLREIGFSPDGSRLLVSLRLGDLDRTAGGTIMLHETTSGGEVARHRLPDDVRHLVFSQNGLRLAGCGRDRAHELDLRSGKWRGLSIPNSESGGVPMAIGESADGWWIAEKDSDDVRIWDAEHVKFVATIHLPRERVQAMVLDPYRRRLVTVSEDTIWVWDPVTALRTHVLRGMRDCHPGAWWSIDRQRLLRVAKDGGILTWDLPRCRDVVHVPLPNGAWRLLGGGDRLIGVDFSGHLATWRCDTGERMTTLRVPPLIGVDGKFAVVGIAPDGGAVAIGRKDGRLQAWNLETQRRTELRGHVDAITAIDVDRGSTHAVSASRDKTVRVWQLAQGGEKHVLRHDSEVLSARFDPAGGTVATGCADGTVRLWDGAQGSVRHRLEGHKAAVTSVAFSPEGDRLLTATETGEVRLWATDTGTLVAVLVGARPEEHVAPIAHEMLDRVWTGNGRRVVLPVTGAVVVFEVGRGQRLAELHPPDGVGSAAPSPDGDRVASLSTDGKSLGVWDTRFPRERSAPQEVVSIRLDEENLGASFSRDGRRLIAWSSRGVTIWNASR